MAARQSQRVTVGGLGQAGERGSVGLAVKHLSRVDELGWQVLWSLAERAALRIVLIEEDRQMHRDQNDVRRAQRIRV